MFQQYFLSDDFCNRMTVIVGDLSHGNQKRPPVQVYFVQ